jgi:hypothetical protein
MDHFVLAPAEFCWCAFYNYSIRSRPTTPLYYIAARAAHLLGPPQFNTFSGTRLAARPETIAI